MRYAIFFRFSAFSHTNMHVLNGLKARFPDIEFVDIDLRPSVKATKIPIALSIVEAIGRYGVKRLRGDGGKAFALRTGRGWDFLSEAARSAVKALPHATPPLFTFQTQTVFDGKIPGIPHFVYTDHAHLANLYYPGFKLDQLLTMKWIEAEARALREADVVFVMSKHVETVLKEIYHLEPGQVERVGVGYNASKAPEGGPRAPATILFVGLHWERKGGPTLIDAMDKVVKTRPDARLVVVGCHPPVARPYLESVGRVPLEAVAQYYQTSTLFCFPTRQEPFGIVVLEAMANNLPPIVPSLGAFPDFVSDGVTGYVFRPNDVESLASAILSALNQSPDERKAIGVTAQHLVQERYTWEGTIDRIASTIEARVPATVA